MAVTAGQALPELLAGPDGSDIVAKPSTSNPGERPVGIELTRIAADGAVSGTATVVAIPFGGGYATLFARIRAPAVTPLGQSGFRAGGAFPRANGSADAGSAAPTGLRITVTVTFRDLVGATATASARGRLR